MLFFLLPYLVLTRIPWTVYSPRVLPAPPRKPQESKGFRWPVSALATGEHGRNRPRGWKTRTGKTTGYSMATFFSPVWPKTRLYELDYYKSEVCFVPKWQGKFAESASSVVWSSWLFSTEEKIQFHHLKKKKVFWNWFHLPFAYITEEQFWKSNIVRWQEETEKRKIAPMTLEKLSIFHLPGALPPFQPPPPSKLIFFFKRSAHPSNQNCSPLG